MESLRIAKEQRESEQKNLNTQMKNPSSVQPVTKNTNTPIKNWDAHFGDMSDDREKAMSFGSDLDKVFMNALNGQYKGYVEKKGISGNTSKTLTELGSQAWNIATLAKNMKNQDDWKKLQEMKSSFQSKFETANALVNTHSKNLGLTFDDNYRVVDPEKLSDYSQQTVVRKGFGTNQQVKETGFFSQMANALLNGPGVMDSKVPIEGIEDKTYAYRKIQTSKHDMQELLKSSYTPAINSWAEFGFANWNNDRFGGEEGKHDNKELMVSLSTTALNHISRYGSVNEHDQVVARELNNKLKNISNASDKQQFIRTNSNEIKSLIDGMGYYGKQKIVESHKNKFSSQYYQGQNSKEQSDNMSSMLNEITTLSEQKKKTDETFGQLQLKAAKEVKLQLNSNKDSINKIDLLIKDLMFDVDNTTFDKNGMPVISSGTGRIKSFDEVRKELGGRVINGVWQAEVPEGYGNKQDVNAYGLKGSNYATYNYLKDAYDNVAKKYHQKFNDLKSDEVFNESLLVAGLGKDRSQIVGHDNIDFKNDSAKNRNAHTIKNLISDGLENGNAYLAMGDYDASAIESNLATVPTEDRKKIFDNFIKNDTKYDVSFSRNSPIANKSAYIFTTREKNPKSMTFYVDTKSAMTYGEKYAQNSYTTPQEYSYKQSGKWDLSAWEDQFKYTNVPQIVTEGGVKYLKAEFFNLERGDYEAKKIFLGPDGSTQIPDAEKTAKEILQKYEHEVNLYKR